MADGPLFESAKPAERDLPPHSIDAEQALLGAILSDNEIVNKIIDALKEEHFYDPVHGRIFTSAKAIAERGDLADAITLAPMAETDEGLKALGGGDYLVELMAAGASAAYAPDYAKLIYDAAIRRNLIRVGGEIDKDARDVRDKAAIHLVEDAEQKLFQLAEAGGVSRGFVSFSEAMRESVEMAAAAKAQGGISGVSSGFKALDAKLGGLHPSDLIIIAGRPSMGKTAFATNIAFEVARHYRSEIDDLGQKRTAEGGVVAFFSLEMSSEQLATRILAHAADIPSHLIRQGKIDGDQFERLRDRAIELDAAPLYIDDTGGISIGALCARARRLKRQHGLDMIIIDYLQLVTPSGDRRGDSRVQEVSQVTQQLKALAKELNVPVIALSQLSRQVEQRDDKRPQLSDLRESGSIEQDADVVMFVYREEYYLSREAPSDSAQSSGDAKDAERVAKHEDRMRAAQGKAEIIIGKQRHGPIGDVKLGFDGSVTRFFDLVEDLARVPEQRGGASTGIGVSL